MKDKIEHFESNHKSTESTSDDEYSKLKINYKILKHELKITNLKFSLKNDPRKIESNLKTENSDLKVSLAKQTSEFETLKEDHKELHK